MHAISNDLNRLDNCIHATLKDNLLKKKEEKNNL